MVILYPCSRVFLATVWIVVVVILCTGGFTHGVQHCLQCLPGESAAFCNASSSLRECGGDTDMCYTNVTNVGGKLFSTKGCILAQLCHHAAKLNDEFCDQGIASGRCYYCCIGDSCNYDRFKYKSSLPTTAIATTTSLLSTLAPSTCDNENLTRCTKDYEEAILVAMKDPRTNFPYFCRQVPVMFQCIAEAMASCCPDNQLALHDQLSTVSDVMWSQCPRECDVIQGQLCTSGTVTKVISKVIYGSCDCETLRTYVIEYQKCLVINVGTCGTIERIGFDVRAKLIKSAVEVICTQPDPTQSPPEDVTTALPTTGPGCEPEIVEQCLVRLAINLTQTGGPNYDVICGTLLPETEDCFTEHTLTCPPSTKERLEHAFNFTRQLMMQNCTATTEPPAMCDTTAARTCAVEIWRVIDEVGDYGLACSMVQETVDCVLSNVTGCTLREKQSLNRTLEIVLKRLEGQCEKPAEMDGECSDVELVEGGAEWAVRFYSNYDPEDLCNGEQDCKVYVEVVVEKIDSPKCQNGDSIPQIMCRPKPRPKSGPACGVQITSENWKETHTINLAATLDNKMDGDKTIKVKLVYTKVIKGRIVEVMTLETCEVKVIDHDTNGQCASLNDPHIKTFDGVLYDNFFEGVFVLYRHTRLPYEVQVLYQRCGQASCNCGVAVKSGDYVFFAQRCRRKKSRCRRGRKCKDLLSAKSFVWDEVTDGTRVFKRPDGFEVLLPHGTRVTIQHQKKLSLLNIWVTPSSADYMNTTGLCGVYDGSVDKDLVLPNGEPYTGPNVRQNKQPKDFCRAWRITDSSKWLHKGAPYNPYYPPQYCVCEDQWCQKVDCSARHLVSTCDFNTEGEILFEEVPKIKGDVEVARRKRAVDDDSDFDFDIDFEPEEIDPSTRQWSEQDARIFCQAYMDGSNVVGLCQFQAGVEVLHYVNICIQDILLADDTKFAVSALEGVKAECVNMVKTDPKFADSETNKHVVVQIEKASCPVECSEQGTCDEGKCQCEDNYVGETCDVKADAVPSYIMADHDGLCNSRMTDCSYIVIYADDIIKSNTLTCHVSAVQVTEIGVSNTTSNSMKVKAQYFSSNQVICRVRSGTLSHGYYVDLSNDGEKVSGEPMLYVAHDPHCFDCQITDEGATCIRKSDTCVVEGKCYISGETDPEDACSMCDPASSTSTLRKNKSLACLGPFAMLIIAGVAIVLIVLAAIVIWYCCCHRRRPKKSYKSKMEEGIANELIQRRR